MTDHVGADRFELADGEEVVFSCRPAKAPRWIFYLVTLGLYEFWRRATVYGVTDRRVIVRKGIVTTAEGSLPLHYVQDAAIQSFAWWGAVGVSTAGGESGEVQTLYVAKAAAQRFRREIIDRAHVLRPKAR